MAERTVNARQLAVLEWIVDGCPDGVMTGTTHKTTGGPANPAPGRRQQEARRLEVAATAAGRYFIGHGSYPAGHWTSFTLPTTTAKTPLRRVRPTVPAGNERKITALRPVDQMIADIVSAGGSLDVEDDGGYYDNLVSSAIRHGKVPDGKLLQIKRGAGWREKTLQLVDKPVWMTAVLDPIEVPERLTRPHAAVAALRADREHRLELRAAAVEERRREQERAAAERRRGWEQVRDEAVVALREHTRATVLAGQVTRWRRNQLLVDYLTAMEERIVSLEGGASGSVGVAGLGQGPPAADRPTQPAPGPAARPGADAGRAQTIHARRLALRPRGEQPMAMTRSTVLT